MFKLSGWRPTAAGPFPGVFPNELQENFDSVPNIPTKMIEDIRILCRKKSGTSSHIAARTALTGGALLRLTKPLSEASNNGSDSWNYLKPM